MGFKRKVLELRAYIIGLGGFGVSIYLLEFLLISPFCYASCVYSLRLAFALVRLRSPVIECALRKCRRIDPCFTCRLVRRTCRNLLLGIGSSDCCKRITVFRQLKCCKLGASLFACRFLLWGFGFGESTSFENLRRFLVSFAVGVVGRCLHCS